MNNANLRRCVWLALCRSADVQRVARPGRREPVPRLRGQHAARRLRRVGRAQGRAAAARRARPRPLPAAAGRALQRRTAARPRRPRIRQLRLAVAAHQKTRSAREYTSCRPGNGETICPPPAADGSSIRGGSTSVRGRVRSLHITGGRRCLSCRQPACVEPTAAARLGQLRHGTDGRIAVSFNAPVRREHNNSGPVLSFITCSAYFRHIYGGIRPRTS